MKKQRTLTAVEVGSFYPLAKLWPTSTPALISSSWTGYGPYSSPQVTGVETFADLYAKAVHYYNRARDPYDGYYRIEYVPPSVSSTETFTSTERTRPIFNDCSHTKHTRINTSFGLVAEYTSLNERMVVPHMRWDNPPPISFNDDHWTHVGTENLDAARSRAWAEMQPHFEGEVNLLVSLFELKDFKDILKYGVKSINKIRGFNLGAVQKDLERKARKGVLDPTIPAAEGVLLYNFAIAPIVSDFAAIVANLQKTVSEAQEQFQNAGNEVQKTHYSEFLNQTTNLVSNSWSYRTIYCKSDRSVHETKFTATLEYTYKYTMREAHAAFIRYWGLSGSFEAFWNMIPFSFLVDYFVNIGHALHVMEKDPNVVTRDVQYCESLLTTYRNGYWLITNPNRGNWHIHLDGVETELPNWELRHLAGVVSSSYTRLRCDPHKGFYVPKVSLPNSRRALNMLALARTFLSKKRI